MSGIKDKPWFDAYKNRSEFVIYKVIEKVNQTRIANGDRPITFKQAMGYRDAIINKLTESADFSSITGQFDKALMDVTDKSRVLMCVQPEGAFRRYSSVSAETIDVYEQKSQNRRNVFYDAINSVIPEVNMNEQDYNDLVKKTYVGYKNQYGDRLVPVSPFDSQIYSRESVISGYGGLYLVNEGVLKDEDGKNTYDGVFRPTEVTAEPFYRINTPEDWKSNDGFIRESGPIYSQKDRSGIAAMKPYMTSDDYDKISGVYDGILKTPGFNHHKISDIQKSVELLKTLSDEGYSYTMKIKRHGEICATLNGAFSGADITIVPAYDSNFDSNFGKVYNNGVTYRFTTDKQDADKKNEVYKPSVSDAFNLIRYATGQTVIAKDGKVVGSTDVITKTYTNGNKSYQNRTYRSVYGTSARYGDYSRYYNVSITADTKGVKPRTLYFGGKDADGNAIAPQTFALDYLTNAISSARVNYENEMNLEKLIEEANAHKGDEDYVFEFSKDDAISAIQQKYWNTLVSDDAPKIPVVGTEDYEFDDAVETKYYEGSKEEQVRAHFADSLEADVGSYEVSTDGKRFNPIGVSTYMDSVSSVVRNNDNILVAMQLLGVEPEELRGSDFYNNVVKNKLIKYDPAKSKPMNQHGSVFIRNMGEEVKQSLIATGYIVDDNDIRIDDNGIVEYKVKRVVGKTAKSPSDVKTEDVTGYIGQIFEPDGYGTVTTKFGDGNNYMFVPGYTATVLPQKIGESKTMEERTRLKGYEQHMREAIRAQIHKDSFVKFANYDGAPVGMTSSLNGVYRQLYDVRHPVDYIERTIQEGMSEDFYKAVITTEARRVRYDSSFKEGATLNASFQANLYPERQFNDLNMDALSLTDGRNVAIMSREGDGYFDPDATSTGMNQGITRYLVESAEVQPDGSIKRGDLDDKTPLCKHSVMKWADYVPFDRRQMVFNNAIKAQRITDKVKTAQMTFGGWNFDDGFIVTKQFAETYKVRGKNDKLRDIIVGDKILDKNGNKGVISLVIDPDMSMEEAREKGLENVLSWVKANPDVQVYGAPYPAVSRFNGGTARELMENTSDLIGPDGNVHKGCVGEAEFIVTHMTVDEKTHIYDDKEFEEGNGRRASAQLAWALDSKDATAIKREFYTSNDKAFTNMREYFIATGFDLNEVGDVMRGYTPHESEVRNVFTLPEMPEEGFTTKGIRENTQEFMREIRNKGGFLELPFPLKFPNDDTIPMVQIELEEDLDVDVKSDVNYKKDSWVVNRNGQEIIYHRNRDLLENGGSKTTTKTIKAQEGIYAMPIMSSYLRSGQEYEDGTVSVHDYTNAYQQIYKSAQDYLNAKREGNERAMVAAQEAAQRQFDSITHDIVDKKFESKYNYFKEGLMSNRLKDSATAVWTADPRLSVDDIAISRQMAEAIGVKDGDYVLTWRDPVLRDAGVSAKRAVISDEITGAAINPVMDKGYDGDFDGDSIGIKELETEAAKQEAIAKFSTKANLLDYGAQNEDGTYELMMNHGLDLKTAEFVRPELKDRYKEITKRVNDFESDFLSGKITAEELDEKRIKAVDDINAYVQDAFQGGVGEAIISYNDMESHIKSCEQVVISGAKGNYKKLEDYANYLGVSYEREDVGDDEPRIKQGSVKDLGLPFGGDKVAAREASLSTEYATSVKTSVGVAGKVSQRGMKGCRNKCPKAVLETTYPATQGLLQAKHDRIDARQKYATLMLSVRDLWKGYKLDLVQMDMVDEKGHKLLDENGNVRQTEVFQRAYERDGKGKLVYDENNKPIPKRATKEEFIEQMMAIYTRKDMLNVAINPDYVKDVANAMSDDTGHMRNIEDADIGSPMDRLAYRSAGVSSIDVLNDMAKKGENIFAGKYNKGFMPRSVYRNVQKEFRNVNYSNHEYEAMDTLSKSDTKDKTKTAKKVFNQEDAAYLKDKVESMAKRRTPSQPTGGSGNKNPGDLGE